MPLIFYMIKTSYYTNFTHKKPDYFPWLQCYFPHTCTHTLLPLHKILISCILFKDVSPHKISVSTRNGYVCCSHLTGLQPPGYVDDRELKHAKMGISNGTIYIYIYIHTHTEFHENCFFNVNIMVQNLFWNHILQTEDNRHLHAR
jgi:hypothetical protein